MSAPPLGLTARAIVTRIIDGDTLDVELRWPVRIRMLNCYAPEIHGEEKPKGEKAKRALERMAPPGTQVHINIPTEKADSLGDILTLDRVLGLVWVEGDDESLSELMVAQGLAKTEKVPKK